jgi:hypothetical protein
MQVNQNIFCQHDHLSLVTSCLKRREQMKRKQNTFAQACLFIMP